VGKQSPCLVLLYTSVLLSPCSAYVSLITGFCINLFFYKPITFPISIQMAILDYIEIPSCEIC